MNGRLSKIDTVIAVNSTTTTTTTTGSANALSKISNSKIMKECIV